MGVRGEEQRSDFMRRLRRFWAPFSIILTVLYVWYFACEVYEHYHPEDSHKVEVRESLLDSMQASMMRQQAELKAVDPMALFNVFTTTLEETNCNWIFQCEQKVTELRTFKFLGFTRELPPAEPEVQLMYHVSGPIYVPTATTIKGGPHALVRMMGAIWDTGSWAVVMFLSCTVIYVALLLAASQGENNGLLVYCMLIGSLIGISLMVAGMQWVGELVLTKAGSVLGMVAALLAPSGALALLVGIPHVMKAPGEVKEAVEVIKAVA